MLFYDTKDGEMLVQLLIAGGAVELDDVEVVVVGEFPSLLIAFCILDQLLRHDHRWPSSKNKDQASDVKPFPRVLPPQTCAQRDVQWAHEDLENVTKLFIAYRVDAMAEE